MEQIIPNKLWINHDLGLFYGLLTDNAAHKHYALQISLSLDGLFQVSMGDNTVHTQSICLASQIAHAIDAKDKTLLLLLVNPASRLGLALQHYLAEHSHKTNIPAGEKLHELAKAWQHNKLSDAELTAYFTAYTNAVTQAHKPPTNNTDDRVNTVMKLIEKDPAKLRSIKEVAALVHLSPDRFRHLFRQHTGITFTRMQLWYKLLGAFKMMGQGKNFTELAHANGFADSAHFSRTFKETFGLTPAQVLKNSRSVQVS